MVQPLLDQLGYPSEPPSLEPQDWLTSVMRLAPATSPDQLNTTLASDMYSTFFATSTFVSQEQPLLEPAATALMDYLYGPGTETEVSWFVNM